LNDTIKNDSSFLLRHLFIGLLIVDHPNLIEYCSFFDIVIDFWVYFTFYIRVILSELILILLALLNLRGWLGLLHLKRRILLVVLRLMR